MTYNLKVQKSSLNVLPKSKEGSNMSLLLAESSVDSASNKGGFKGKMQDAKELKKDVVAPLAQV